MIPIVKRLALRIQTRSMNFEGELNGTIVEDGKWWVDFQSKLKALGFTVEQIPLYPQVCTDYQPTPNGQPDGPNHECYNCGFPRSAHA